MIKQKKENSFTNVINNGLSYISKLVSTAIFSHMAEGAEIVMDTIDDRIIRIEKRIQRKIYSIFLTLFGGIFLIFSIFFFLKEFLMWNNAAAFFSIGIIIFVIGLLLKIGESERRENG